MSRKLVAVELDISLDDLGRALADLSEEDLGTVLEVADGHMQDWQFVQSLWRWVGPRRRQWEQEEVDAESQARQTCVQSLYSPDIWAHTDPHVNCILR